MCDADENGRHIGWVPCPTSCCDRPDHWALHPHTIPGLLVGEEGEEVYVSVAVADTPEAAIAYADLDWDVAVSSVKRVLMRPLDPIACKIRGVDDGWWVECTPRSKKAQPFWKVVDAG